ncbi:tRNA (guanosine-2'-O-)-methyltransferase [Robiginitalea myxolifaciens]|uniref:tRNA (guanosine(18)-2'-O)-methyltransferase n=1 Tax=Robiginitalea myxolifaciens TaxID=400055 RepID=A0A1I6FMN0_9FLAO|nr:RNA methyltransferase [Robiginitalea myxolifaciens]SFR31196.1 tRNA (guanosine-2'-O-)-methyltransferase [Robiginitalea myxolifaciens]
MPERKPDLLSYLQGYLTPSRLQRFEEILDWRTRHITVVLEDVFQLHNASAVVRSCDVFGIQDVHLIEDRFGRRLDKNIALGAQKWVSIHRQVSAAACMESLRAKGYKIVATTPHVSAIAPQELPLDVPIALFFGTEKEGLSDVVLNQADCKLKIPMYGFTESLNVSVAAAIVLNTLRSRLNASDIPWQIPEKQRDEIRLDWTKKTIKSVEDIISRYQESP